MLRKSSDLQFYNLYLLDSFLKWLQQSLVAQQHVLDWSHQRISEQNLMLNNPKREKIALTNSENRDYCFEVNCLLTTKLRQIKKKKPAYNEWRLLSSSIPYNFNFNCITLFNNTASTCKVAFHYSSFIKQFRDVSITVLSEIHVHQFFLALCLCK